MGAPAASPARRPPSGSCGWGRAGSDGPGMQAEPEVVGDPVAQALGLADIDDAVGRIPEEVDAAGFRDVSAAGPPGRTVSHRPIVGAVRLAPVRFGLLETGKDPCALGRNGRGSWQSSRRRARSL